MTSRKKRKEVFEQATASLEARLVGLRNAAFTELQNNRNHRMTVELLEVSTQLLLAVSRCQVDERLIHDISCSSISDTQSMASQMAQKLPDQLCLVTSGSCSVFGLLLAFPFP